MLVKIKNAIQKGAVVLMYHRIGEPGADPWQLSVSPVHFKEHLQVLAKTKSVQPLKEIVHVHHRKTVALKPTLAITFDDAYVDNYVIAKPLLEEFGLPATFFVSHHNINMVKEYWWDELEKILLHSSTLPPSLQIDINGEAFDYTTEPFRTSDLIPFYFGREIQGVPNLDLYINLWKRMQPLPMLLQQQILNSLRNWAGLKNDARKDYCCMSSDQLVKVAETGIFEIGVHTDTHPALSFHNKEFQQEEIRKNKIWLEQLTQRRMRFCAYPYGNFNSITRSIVGELNFDAAFTTQAGKIKKNTDRFTMGRFQVKNWGGEEFRRHLQSWIKAY